jgi:hypothetical protein
LKERIRLSFLPNRRIRAVPWQHSGCIRQHQQTIAQGAQNLASIASGKIGSADRSGKQRIPGQQQAVFGEEETDAAGRVSWSVYYFRLQGGEAHGQAIVGTGIRGHDFGRGNTEPTGLYLHCTQQTQILLVEKHRRPGRLLEQCRSAYVIDVSMSDNDLAQVEAMFLQPGKYLWNVVSGIDDYGFMGDLVAQDGAVTVQRAYGKTFEDHALILGD